MIDTPRETAAWQDPIMAEVRAARQALFAAAGCDIREFCRRLRAEQDVSGHRVVARASDSGIPRPEDAA
jgi:hypothetical protein